jgi:integrase
MKGATMTVPLEQLFRQGEAFLRERGCSESTVGSYASAWRAFARFYRPSSDKRFSVAMANRYLNSLKVALGSGQINESTLAMAARAIRRLVMLASPEGAEKNRPQRRTKKRSHRKIKLRGRRLRELDESFGDYLKAMSLSRSTITHYGICARKFLRWVGKKVFSGITAVDAVSYVISELAAQASLASELCALRHLFVFLYDINITGIDYSVGIPRIPRRPAHEPPVLSRDEEAALLASFDRATQMGARDYAMTLLALRTGLRSSDIVALRLQDIDLKNKTACIVQAKTGMPLNIPVASDAIAALRRYIDGHRPRVSTGTVFLSVRGLPLKRIYHISRKALDGARIKLGQPKRGFHLYRFTFVARMMENNRPIDTVSDLLGHSSKLSAVPYLTFSEALMRRCCLPLSDICPGQVL